MATLKPQSNGPLSNNKAIGTQAVDGWIWWKISRFSTNISLYLRNDTWYGHSYNEIL